MKSGLNLINVPMTILRTLRGNRRKFIFIPRSGGPFTVQSLFSSALSNGILKIGVGIAFAGSIVFRNITFEIIFFRTNTFCPGTLTERILIIGIYIMIFRTAALKRSRMSDRLQFVIGIVPRTSRRIRAGLIFFKGILIVFLLIRQSGIGKIEIVGIVRIDGIDVRISCRRKRS